MDNIEIDYKFKENLIKDIEKNLNINEQIEICKIILSDTNRITENSNGIFINLNILSEKTIKQLRNYTNFCINMKNNVDNLKYGDINIGKEEDPNLYNNLISKTEDSDVDSFFNDNDEEINITDNENYDINNNIINIKNNVDELDNNDDELDNNDDDLDNNDDTLDNNDLDNESDDDK